MARTFSLGIFLRQRLFIFACVLCLALPLTAAANSEAITNYAIDITLQPNGRADIVERITYDFVNYRGGGCW